MAELAWELFLLNMYGLNAASLSLSKLIRLSAVEEVGFCNLGIAIDG